MIRMKCPHCEAGLRITDDLAGTAGDCPDCGSQFVIPSASESAAVSNDASDAPIDVENSPTDPPTDLGGAPTTEAESDTAQPFDPMDVLTHPIEQSAPEPVPETAEVSPIQSAIEDKDVVESDEATPNTVTAAAAAVAMQQQRRATIPVQPAPSAERVALKDEIREKFSSKEQILETFREQPLYLVFAGLILVAGVALMPKGCDDGRVPVYPVSGRVVFKNGAPVKTGKIELRSEAGTTANGTIKEDGSFVLGTYTRDDGAAAGMNQAIVMQIVIYDGTADHVKDHGLPVSTLHSKYETSGLRFEVTPDGPNKLLVEVNPQPKRRGYGGVQ